MAKYFGISYQKVPQDNPPAIDWLTHKPLTYDINHSDGFIFLNPSGHEVFATTAAPNYSGKLPSQLQNFLSDRASPTRSTLPNPDGRRTRAPRPWPGCSARPCQQSDREMAVLLFSLRADGMAPLDWSRLGTTQLGWVPSILLLAAGGLYLWGALRVRRMQDTPWSLRRSGAFLGGTPRHLRRYRRGDRRLRRPGVLRPHDPTLDADHGGRAPVRHGSPARPAATG